MGSVCNDHMITSATPTCTKGTGTSSGISCVYDTTYRKLTVSNVITGTAKGTTLSFSVYPFTNPYNAIPKIGFSLYTADSSGYYIDASTSLTVTATNFAEFSYALFDRIDYVTTVNELSLSYLSFGLGFPVDVNCVVNITFPTLMPITSDLTSVSGYDIFS